MNGSTRLTIKRTPPDRIWLQYWGDEESLGWAEAEEINEDGVTWTEKKVFKHDIQYVRVGRKRKTK